MATNHGHGNGAELNPSVEYDKSDLGARGILIFFLVLGVFAVVIHLCVLGLYAGMTRIAEKYEPEVSPLAPQTYTPRAEILTNTANVNIQQFPEPRLLHHVGESGEMSKFLEQETVSLTAQPWQDDEGNVHLPIDQAMKAVVGRLPVRAGGVELPNYPGAARDYSYPTAPVAAAEPVQTTPGDATPSETMPGETGNPAAGK